MVVPLHRILSAGVPDLFPDAHTKKSGLASGLATRDYLMVVPVGSLLGRRYPRLDSPLWNASLLHSHPEDIKDTHLLVLSSEVIITTSYQAILSAPEGIRSN